jgi:hypothetical protein
MGAFLFTNITFVSRNFFRVVKHTSHVAPAELHRRAPRTRFDVGASLIVLFAVLLAALLSDPTAFLFTLITMLAATSGSLLLRVGA